MSEDWQPQGKAQAEYQRRGDWLRLARVSLGLSQRDLSRKVGPSRSMLARCELGARNADDALLLRLNRLLDRATADERLDAETRQACRDCPRWVKRR